MLEQRLLFRKEGRAKYISHLDLLHTMQRAFIRAGISIRHTNGFNPHPYMSFALPLSVGQESVCELMDFGLASDIPIDRIPAMLNEVLQEGLVAVSAYNAERKLSELKWLRVSGVLRYFDSVPEEAVDKIQRLFRSAPLVVEKKGKKGLAETDISSMIQSVTVSGKDGSHILLDAVIAAQNPSLNPALLLTAAKTFAAEAAPDAASFRREEVYDSDLRVFR